MWKPVIVATAVLTALASSAEARAPRRVVHIYADTIVIHHGVIHPRAVALRSERMIVHGDRIIRVRKAKRPTKAAQIACQMGPNFLGAAWRGKRYRPYTRSGRPRICVTETG